MMTAALGLAGLGPANTLTVSVTSSVHSHPLDPVARLLLDDFDAAQDVGDVVNPTLAGLQARGHVPQVQCAIWRSEQQVQETSSQQNQGHV